MEGLFLRAPSSRPASAWSGLHMPPPPGGFSVKQRCGQDHGWLVTLCPLAQGNLTTPPIGPVIERNPARVCSVLHIFPVKFICSGDLERESVGYVSFWLIFKSPLRIHSFCALRPLWPLISTAPPPRRSCTPGPLKNTGTTMTPFPAHTSRQDSQAGPEAQDPL